MTVGWIKVPVDNLYVGGKPSNAIMILVHIGDEIQDEHRTQFLKTLSHSIEQELQIPRDEIRITAITTDPLHAYGEKHGGRIDPNKKLGFSTKLGSKIMRSKLFHGYYGLVAEF